MDQPSLFADNLTHYLALLAIVGAIVVVIKALYVSYFAFTGGESKILSLTSRYVLPLGFFVSLIGVSLSLYYSEVLHLVPCDLCWFQRIFLYPQLFLFGYAWFRKDRSILPYNFMLSLIGLAIALYHHLLQMGYDVYKPCSTAPFAVDCSKPSFIEYGFVTFPFMAVVIFGFLSVLIGAALWAKKRN